MNLRAQQQLLHLFDISRKAINSQIAFSWFLFVPTLFGFTDDIEDWHFAVGILIHAYAQIDLGWVGVVVESFGQTDDRIGRRLLDVCEW